MTGDFTRDSFDPDKDYTRVLMQQGRPQLDADLNEQASIFWHYLRTLAADMIGPYAGPHDNCGFGVTTPSMIDKLPAKDREEVRKMLKSAGDFLVSPGRYYVDGFLCENKQRMTYSSQIGHPEKLTPPQRNTQYLVYLDVWERPVSHLEDSAIHEPALNGIDTSLRAKVVWRVRMAEISDKSPYGGDCVKIKEHWPTITRDWQPQERGLLVASVADPDSASADEHGHGNLDGRYQGPHNQLYRVQVHQGGSAGGSGHKPTFKVSRENGSVMFGIDSISGDTVTLAAVGRDSRFGLQAGDWVEICDGTGATLMHDQKAPPLSQVTRVDAGRRQVMLSGTPAVYDDKGPFILRRWDHRAGDKRKGELELSDGAVLIKEGGGKGDWLLLENGLRIQFQKSSPANVYRTGDYWLIPARVGGNGVIWPKDSYGKPKAVAPHGVHHHYAPLAVLAMDGKGVLEAAGDCRLTFKMPVTFGF
jgi:hypothetical protein